MVLFKLMREHNITLILRMREVQWCPGWLAQIPQLVSDGVESWTQSAWVWSVCFKIYRAFAGACPPACLDQVLVEEAEPLSLSLAGAA